MPDRIQFSVRALLLLTALVALAAAIFTWKPSLCSLVARGVLTIIVATLTIAASVYTERGSKAFWIGAAVPTVLAAWISTTAGLQIIYTYRALGAAAAIERQIEVTADMERLNLIFWCYAPINGLICAVVYSLLAHARRRAE